MEDLKKNTDLSLYIACLSKCSFLTSIPLIDTSSGIDFIKVWKNCKPLDEITN